MFTFVLNVENMSVVKTKLDFFTRKSFTKPSWSQTTGYPTWVYSASHSDL